MKNPINKSLPFVIATSVLSLICQSNPMSAQESSVDIGDQQKERSATKYIRQAFDENNQPRSMQTAITRFVNRDKGLTVDLVGVVHIGDKTYYQVLNELFTDYDVVLYELVAPEENNVPQPGHRSSNPLAFLQKSMQDMLGLSSQLALVDYTPSNFVHADLTPQEMKQKMEERGQTGWSVAFSAFSEMMNNPAAAQQSMGGKDMSFSELMDTFSTPYKLRRMMAEQFSGENIDTGLGKTLNQMIVVDRNIAAMEVLDEQVDQGHKKIAIFYGAAHMPDFEKRLNDQGYEISSQAWVDAWDLRASVRSQQESPLSPLMKMLDELSR